MQAVRKLHGHLKAVKEAAVERSLPQAKPITLTPQEQSLDEDLNEAAQVECSPCIFSIWTVSGHILQHVDHDFELKRFCSLVAHVGTYMCDMYVPAVCGCCQSCKQRCQGLVCSLASFNRGVDIWVSSLLG